MGRTHNNVTHAGNGREVRLDGVQNVKVDGYCKDTKSLSTSGVFGMGVFACPIDTNPFATKMRHCITGMRKHKRGCKKAETLVIMLF